MFSADGFKVSARVSAFAHLGLVVFSFGFRVEGLRFRPSALRLRNAGFDFWQVLGMGSFHNVCVAGHSYSQQSPWF